MGRMDFKVLRSPEALPLDSRLHQWNQLNQCGASPECKHCLNRNETFCYEVCALFRVVQSPETEYHETHAPFKRRFLKKQGDCKSSSKTKKSVTIPQAQKNSSSKISPAGLLPL